MCDYATRCLEAVTQKMTGSYGMSTKFYGDTPESLSLFPIFPGNYRGSSLVGKISYN